MTGNAHTGEVTLSHDGVTLTLHLDWRALGAARTRFGGRALLDILDGDPAEIAELLAIAVQRHHPDWTAERIIEWSPPIILTGQALLAVLNYANWGPGGPPAEKTPANPPAPAAETGATRSPAPTAPPSGPGSRRSNSGS